MIARLWGLCRAVWRFRGYRPQPVTFGSLSRWIKQFDSKDRKAILSLLNGMIYLSENETKERLVKFNDLLLSRLANSGIEPNKVIYVQVDEAGSSSPVMLNMLKEAARLERKRCRFVDSRDVLGLNKAANELGEGAIIYVDDFAGTGDQFCRSRDFVAQYIVGSFSEFLLLPVICEEAIYQLAKRGIEAVGQVHSKVERPLHENSYVLDFETKNRLTDICFAIDRKGGLGYRKLATTVVFYRNVPNSAPVLLRGNVGQEPYVGVLPRTQDLPT